MAITNPDVSLSEEELYRKKKKEEKAKEKELKRFKAAQKAEAAKLKELETGVYPTRGQIYVKGHTRKNGKIVNGKVSEVVASLQAISSESSSSTQGSVSNFSNDDYSQVKGLEKRGYIRCVGRMSTIKKVASSTRNPDPAMEELKAVVGAMAKIIQENIPNSNLSTLRCQVALHLLKVIITGVARYVFG